MSLKVADAIVETLRTAGSKLVTPAPNALIAVIGASALCGCDAGIFDPHGPVGAADRLILMDSLAIMMVIGLPTIFATLAFAWWFRAFNRLARYRPT